MNYHYYYYRGGIDWEKQRIAIGYSEDVVALVFEPWLMDDILNHAVMARSRTHEANVYICGEYHKANVYDIFYNI